MANPRELKWLLNDLVTRVPEAQYAVVLSLDGLLMAGSEGLARDDAEHLAAMASSYQSLSKGVGRKFRGGSVRQTIVEMDEAFLFVTTAGHGACLAVISTAEAETGLIAYEMAVLVERVGKVLSTPQRPRPAPEWGQVNAP